MTSVARTGTDSSSSLSTKSPSTVTLPKTFTNSFWSHDYRTGFITCYDKLDAGTTSSTELIHTIHQRAQAERSFAHALLPPALKQDGFAADEGASLRVGFEAVLTSAVGESRARLQLADDLERTILAPFSAWSSAHAGRIASSRALVESHLSAYESQRAKTLKLKTAHDDACRAADEAEDELGLVANHHTISTSRSHHRGSSSPAANQPGSAISPKTENEQDDDAKSEDGKSSSLMQGHQVEDEDDGMLPRSGATGMSNAGASIASALGRAFTIRGGGARRNAAKMNQPSGSPGSVGASDQQSGGGGTVSAPTEGKGTGPDDGYYDGEDAAGNAPAQVGAAIDWSKTKISSLLERVAGPQSGEGKVERTRRSADETEQRYKSAVVILDSLRLTLEEALAEHFHYAQRCESDRLRAAASVLRSFHVACAALPQLISQAQARVSATIELVRPDKDIAAMIERNRTGPRWDETKPAGEIVPPVLAFLLSHIERRYDDERTTNAEKRKAWLYETPLTAQHQLRATLNAQADKRVEGGKTFADESLQGYDLPIIASTVRLWLLELEVPPITFTHYDELKHLYPHRVGADASPPVPAKAIADHLSRLPPVHLEVLRAMITHFSDLVTRTRTSDSSDNNGVEEDGVYVYKLALSMSRAVVGRPRVDTSLTLEDRAPTLLFVDLVKSCEDVFRAADELKSGRDDRYRPRRQRTKPVDSRITRAAAGLHASQSIDRETAAELLAQQHHHQQQQTLQQSSIAQQQLDRAREGSQGSNNAANEQRDAEVAKGPESAESSALASESESTRSMPPPVPPVRPPTPPSVPRPSSESQRQVSGAAQTQDGAGTASEGAGPTESAFEPPSTSSVTREIPTIGGGASSSASVSGAGSIGRMRGTRGPRPLSSASATSPTSPELGKSSRVARIRDSFQQQQ